MRTKTSEGGQVNIPWPRAVGRGDFDIKIVFEPGKTNPADALSRRPDYGNAKSGTADAAMLPVLQDLIQDLETGTTREGPGEVEMASAWRAVEYLFQALDAHYITSNERIEASHKFDKLTMGGRPFSDFQADFHKLATKAEKTSSEKVTALRTKVSDALGTTAPRPRENTSLIGTIMMDGSNFSRRSGIGSKKKTTSTACGKDSIWTGLMTAASPRQPQPPEHCRHHHP